MTDDFHKWYNGFIRAWFLIGEHARVDLLSKNVIWCKLCHQEHNSYDSISLEEWSMGIIQGHNICAHSVYIDGRWMIHCGWGSDFDLSEFWYLKDFPTEPVNGICDWCIRRMLRDGIIMDSGKESQL